MFKTWMENYDHCGIVGSVWEEKEEGAKQGEAALLYSLNAFTGRST